VISTAEADSAASAGPECAPKPKATAGLATNSTRRTTVSSRRGAGGLWRRALAVGDGCWGPGAVSSRHTRGPRAERGRGWLRPGHHSLDRARAKERVATAAHQTIHNPHGAAMGRMCSTFILPFSLAFLHAVRAILRSDGAECGSASHSTVSIKLTGAGPAAAGPGQQPAVRHHRLAMPCLHDMRPAPRVGSSGVVPDPSPRVALCARAGPPRPLVPSSCSNAVETEDWQLSRRALEGLLDPIGTTGPTWLLYS
jgi:hypothetical protein